MASGRKSGYVSGFQGSRIGPTPPDLPVPAAGILPLFTIPGDTKMVTIQNTSKPTGFILNDLYIRVREVGGLPGSGVVLGPLGSVSIGGGDGAWAALEVEADATNVGNVAVGMFFERVGIV